MEKGYFPGPDGSLTEETVLVSSLAMDKPVVATRNTKNVNMGKTPISDTVDLNLDGLKNQDQSVETASGKLGTPTESHSDDV
ncbi:hypothetical protein Tco_1002642 [Tanacetum coccineum]|uniref:Uncharacterized protein n=1 Tax=Tanacetum coccineum TaxID=301880 RepID=A0ABQ5F7Q9_9ASTR